MQIQVAKAVRIPLQKRQYKVCIVLLFIFSSSTALRYCYPRELAAETHRGELSYVASMDDGTTIQRNCASLSAPLPVPASSENCLQHLHLALELHGYITAFSGAVLAHDVKRLTATASASAANLAQAIKQGCSPAAVSLHRTTAALLTSCAVIAASRHTHDKEGGSGKLSAAAVESREALSAAAKTLLDFLTTDSCSSMSSGTPSLGPAEVLPLLCAIQVAFVALPAVFRRASHEAAAACVRWGSRLAAARPAASAALAAVLACLALSRKATAAGDATFSATSGSSSASSHASASALLATFLLSSIDAHIAALRAVVAGVPVTVPVDDEIAASLCSVVGVGDSSAGGKAGGRLPRWQQEAGHPPTMEARIELMLETLRGVILCWTPLNGAVPRDGGGAVPRDGGGAGRASSSALVSAFPVSASLAVVGVLCDVQGLHALGVSPPGAVRIAGSSLSLLEGVVDVLGSRALRFRTHILRCVTAAAGASLMSPPARMRACALLARLARSGALGLDGPECVAAVQGVVRVCVSVLLPPDASAEEGASPSVPADLAQSACAVLHELLACRGEFLPDPLRLAIERTALLAVDRGCRVIDDSDAYIGDGASPAATSSGSGAAWTMVGSDGFISTAVGDESGGGGDFANARPSRSKNARYFAGSSGSRSSSQATSYHASSSTRSVASSLLAPPARASGTATTAWELLGSIPPLSNPASASGISLYSPSVATALANLLVQCSRTPWRAGAQSPLAWELQAALARLGFRSGCYASGPPSLLEYGNGSFAAPIGAAVEAEAARMFTTAGDGSGGEKSRGSSSSSSSSYLPSSYAASITAVSSGGGGSDGLGGMEVETPLASEVDMPSGNPSASDVWLLQSSTVVVSASLPSNAMSEATDSGGGGDVGAAVSSVVAAATAHGAAALEGGAAGAGDEDDEFPDIV